MSRNLKGKNGISIEIIAKKIQMELNRKELKTKENNKKSIDKNKITGGKLSTKDWQNIALGMDILTRISRDKFDEQEKLLTIEEKDVSKLRKELVGYRGIIEETLKRLSIGAIDEYEISKKINMLLKYTKVTQAARDGVILKQEKRREKVDGKVKEITYDTSMSSREVIDIFKDYQHELDRNADKKVSLYLSLGLGIAGMLGAIASDGKSKDETMKNGDAALITIGTTAITGLKFAYSFMKKDSRKEEREFRNLGNKMTSDLLNNEPLSEKDEKNQTNSIIKVTEKERNAIHKRANKEFAFNQIMNTAVAIISGAYINKRITLKENGKIDGKSLARALVELETSKGSARYLVRAIQEIMDSKNNRQEFEEISEKVNNIIKQMEEKVYPLEGATHSFDTMKIKNFEGKFYPKKNYETGEINYSSIIKIPEFSMKRGDVVLLSGESGAGKSTFLRYLKRGDINNRYGIELDNGEKVDNLGDEFISFRPSIDLGTETNVLHQITGKWSISELNEIEKERLVTTLKELKFNNPKLLEELASKNFNEFSTGQQRRLALSKVFYRIDDGTSVIIVDEPVGNVEDKLIREQLEMIKRYAEERNVMLILTTHRLDMAEDLATKRYNINKDGVMEELPIKQKSVDNTEKSNTDDREI